MLNTETIGQLPTDAANAWGERTALQFQGRTWSYREFAAEVDRCAAALQALGVRPGERVATWLPNCPEAEFMFFAIARVGAVGVPLNLRYRTQDLAYALRRSGSCVLVSVARSGPLDAAAILRDVVGAPGNAGETPRWPAMPVLRAVVMVDEAAVPGALDWREFQARGQVLEPCAVDPASPALLIFTSGTTGNPKGALLDHSGIRLCRSHAQSLGMTKDDVVVTYLPLFHTYALTLCVIPLFLVGARQILVEAFDAEEVLRMVADDGVSLVHGFDAHFNDFVHVQRRRKFDLSALRTGTLTVGAESSVELAREAQRDICPTVSCYGMTEFWGAVTMSGTSATEDQRCAGSGFPHPGFELRIVDPATGRQMAAEEVGEILVRGYTRMLGYDGDDAATGKAIDADGWYHSGDAGTIRSDGHLRYLARYKDMLKVGGENVSPSEVEALVASIPGVKAVAVVGRPDDRLQEVVVAFVVVDQGATLSEAAIVDGCKGRVASYKLPREVHLVDELPMTPTGKVQKELLRQRLKAYGSTRACK